MPDRRGHAGLEWSLAHIAAVLFEEWNAALQRSPARQSHHLTSHPGVGAAQAGRRGYRPTDGLCGISVARRLRPNARRRAPSATDRCLGRVVVAGRESTALIETQTRCRVTSGCYGAIRPPIQP